MGQAKKTHLVTRNHLEKAKRRRMNSSVFWNIYLLEVLNVGRLDLGDVSVPKIIYDSENTSRIKKT